MLGDATTKPAAAPGISEPLGPILLKAPCKAIAFSETTNELSSLRRRPALGAVRAPVQSKDKREINVVKRMIATKIIANRGKKVYRRMHDGEQDATIYGCLNSNKC